MKTKTENQRFVFADMSYQDFPNSTDQECVVIEKTISLTNKKIVSGQLVEKTAADLAAELNSKNAELDAQYKAERVKALSSPELTIYHDSTLTISEKEKINLVRQQWYNMTAQAGYPENFVRPQLNAQQ